MPFYNRSRDPNFTVDPNAPEEQPLSKSDGSRMASTVIGLLLVVAVFALFYFYMLPAISLNTSAPPAATTTAPQTQPRNP
jgi:hypothetical protein